MRYPNPEDNHAARGPRPLHAWAAAGALLLALAWPVAIPAAGWSAPPVNLSTPGRDTLPPHVAADAAGRATAVWPGSNGSNLIVQSSRYTAAANAWGPLASLSTPGQSAREARVAANAGGDVMAVWARDFTVQAARYPAAGTGWSTPVDLSAANATMPQVAVDRLGNAVVVWNYYDGASHVIQAATYTSASNAWSGAVNVSMPGRDANSPQVVVDSSGNATAAWFRPDGSAAGTTVIQVARYTAATRTWSAPTDLSAATGPALYPALAVDPAGNVFALWHQAVTYWSAIHAARYTASSGTWSSPTVLSAPGRKAAWPHVATDAAGNAAAVWIRSNGSNDVVQSARYTAATGAWSTTVDLSVAGQDAAAPVVGLDANGNALAVWMRWTGTEGIIQSARYATLDGNWSTPVDLSAPGPDAQHPAFAQAPALAVEENGNATAVWQRFDGNNWSVQSSRFVAATPGSVNYQGLWWNPAEPGWGINFAQQADIIFATWFTYDNAGKPWWLIADLRPVPGGAWSGTVASVTGPPFNTVPWDASRVQEKDVGTMTVTFTGTDRGQFAYTVNGVTRSKSITRQVFGVLPVCTWSATGDPAFATNHTALWWKAPGGSEVGWGINFSQQSDIVFATWFTYDAAGKPWWLFGTLTKSSGLLYKGTLATATGPAFDAPFDPAKVVETAVGDADVTFSNDNGNIASFRYTVNGITQTKLLTQQKFAPGGTLCMNPG